MKIIRARKRKSYAQDAFSSLSKEDLERFRSFRIPDAEIAAAGVKRVNTAEAQALGFRFGGPNADLSGRVYVYVDENGHAFTARLRRDHPELDAHGKPQNKYISLANRRRDLYWPPEAWEWLKNPMSEIVLVEAETSALAGMAYSKRAGKKYVFVAMGGCQGWRDKEVGVLPGLSLLRGHKVHILMDSNVRSNKAVQTAEVELAAHLASQGHASDVKCYRLPLKVNGPDDFLAEYKDLDFKRLLDQPVEPWLDQVGESYESYLSAAPPKFVIKDFVQSDGMTIIGGLSGQGKTLISLDTISSLLTGERLFGYFRVLEKAYRVIYLTPEITMGAFKRRAELFKLGPFIKNRQLVVRTLTANPAISLADPALLLSARDADIFLDPAVRFMQGDESSSTDNDRGLAAGIFGLLQSRARSVTTTHHSPKSFERADYMALETILRGTGDIGAMASTAWGVRMLDATRTLVHIENIKSRDFEPPPPFQIQGHPHINEGRGFQMVLEPGNCGALREYVQKKSGRPPSSERAERMASVMECVRDGKTVDQVMETLTAKGMKAPKKSTLKTEMSEARKLLGQKFSAKSNLKR